MREKMHCVNGRKPARYCRFKFDLYCAVTVRGLPEAALVPVPTYGVEEGQRNGKYLLGCLAQINAKPKFEKLHESR